MKTKKLTTKKIRSSKVKNGSTPLSALTCYDFQTAQAFNETDLDIILVGDSLANVILGLSDTVKVSLDEMLIFTKAVSRGAKNKFIVADVPFAGITTYEESVRNCLNYFQRSNCQALKIEGASQETIKILKRLTECGCPVMGHIGLMPQSVHQQGGYYTHGKTLENKERLLKEAFDLQDNGAFAVVLECVDKELAKEISNVLDIPTIGIGSGNYTDGQILVSNDLFGNGLYAPSFCQPLDNFFEAKKLIVSEFIQNMNNNLAGEINGRENSSFYSR